MHISESAPNQLKEAHAPPHLTLPHVLSAIQLSSELGLWPIYRYGVVLLGDVLLSMEVTGMAHKSIEEVETVWDQVSRPAQKDSS